MQLTHNPKTLIEKDILLSVLQVAICLDPNRLKKVGWQINTTGMYLRTSVGLRPSHTFQANVVSFIVRTICGPVISIVS